MAAALTPGKLEAFTPRDVSNTAGLCYGGLRRTGIVRCHGRGRRGAAEFSPQGLANTAWGFAAAGVAAPASSTPRDRSWRTRRPSTPRPSATWPGPWRRRASLMWGEAFEAVAPTGRLAEFKPQEISNLCWSFAKAHVTHGGLFRAVAVEAAPRVATFRPQHLAKFAGARHGRLRPGALRGRRGRGRRAHGRLRRAGRGERGVGLPDVRRRDGGAARRRRRAGRGALAELEPQAVGNIVWSLDWRRGAALLDAWYAVHGDDEKPLQSPTALASAGDDEGRKRRRRRCCSATRATGRPHPTHWLISIPASTRRGRARGRRTRATASTARPSRAAAAERRVPGGAAPEADPRRGPRSLTAGRDGPGAHGAF